jgi:hypothetical protein
MGRSGASGKRHFVQLLSRSRARVSDPRHRVVAMMRFDAQRLADELRLMRVLHRPRAKCNRQRAKHNPQALDRFLDTRCGKRH